MKRRVVNYKLKERPQAFQFTGLKDLDLIEKYIPKSDNYSLNVRENIMIIEIGDLTIKESDYILLKKSGVRIISKEEFESKYIALNPTKKVE